MAFLSVAISVAFLIYLLLRISRMVGGSSTVVSTRPSGPPDLPNRTDAEVETLLATMPTEWVTYNGTTPPLELNVRGLTEELYRRFTKLHLDEFGRHNLDCLPSNEALEVAKSLLPNINAAAYVVDWRGATYPNGNPLPYTPDNMATFMRKDEMLKNFVSDEAKRIGPAW